jgi:kynureninase
MLDCYQSIGTLPLDVVDLGVSFACGGSVKYLCGGPGAGWLYVRPDLIEQFDAAGAPAGSATRRRSRSRCQPRPTPTTYWRYQGGTLPMAALYQSRAGQDHHRRDRRDAPSARRA